MVATPVTHSSLCFKSALPGAIRHSCQERMSSQACHTVSPIHANQNVQLGPGRDRRMLESLCVTIHLTAHRTVPLGGGGSPWAAETSSTTGHATNLCRPPRILRLRLSSPLYDPSMRAQANSSRPSPPRATSAETASLKVLVSADPGNPPSQRCLHALHPLVSEDLVRHTDEAGSLRTAAHRLPLASGMEWSSEHSSCTPSPSSLPAAPSPFPTAARACQPTLASLTLSVPSSRLPFAETVGIFFCFSTAV